MRAVFFKTLRDTLWLGLLVFGGLVLFETLYLRAMGEISSEIATTMLKLPSVQRFVRMLVGADLLDSLTATGLLTVGFAHPLLFALTWTLLLTTCSRIVAGEVDRGTADLLLTLPVSRTRVYVGASAAWLLVGVPLSLAPLAGVALGQRLFPLWEPLDFARLSLLCVNLLALYVAVGGGAMMVSSFASGRGEAVGITLAALLLSVLENFLEQLWPAAEKVAFVGVLHYYRPLPLVRTGEWPVRNLTVLVSVGVAAWLVGLWRFRRRDIPAA